MTHIYIKPSRATNAPYLTRSVRRTSGYVLTRMCLPIQFHLDEKSAFRPCGLKPFYQRRTDNGRMDRCSPANPCSRRSIRLFASLTRAEIGKEGSEDAERGKQRADVVHEVNTGVIGKLAEECGADAA